MHTASLQLTVLLLAQIFSCTIHLDAYKNIANFHRPVHPGEAKKFTNFFLATRGELRLEELKGRVTHTHFFEPKVPSRSRKISDPVELGA